MIGKLALVLMPFIVLSMFCSTAYSELAQARNITIASRNAMSAWTQPKGRIYNQLYYSYHESTNKFTTIERDESGYFVSANGDVDKVETDRFTANTITYHGEFGITDSLTVFASIPWIDTKYDVVIKYSGEDGPSGIGDIDLGLRYNLNNNFLNSDILMSVQGSVKIPEAYNYGHPLTEVSIGDGQYDAAVDVLLGKEWNKGYFILNAGYTFRFENDEYGSLNFKPSDQIRVITGGAYFITPKLHLKGTIDWTKSVRNATVSNDLIKESLGFGGTFWEGDSVLIKDTLGLEQDVLNLGIALAYNFTQQLEAILRYNTDIEGFDNFGTRNAAQVSTYGLGLVLMF
jgi:hypothetical protein